MSELLNRFADALAPGWVGSIIGLAGLLAAFFTYVLSRQRSILAYRSRGIRLLGHSDAKLPEGVTVHYQGRDIPRLTRSLVVFWNAGERTIDGTDIVALDPLRLELGEDASVLSAAVLKSSRTAVGASVDVMANAPGCVHVSFAFLDANDGLIVDILHTGEKRHPVIEGTVRGLPAGAKNRGRILPRRPPPMPFPIPGSRRIFAVIVIVVGTAFAAYGFYLPTSTHSFLERPSVIRYIVAAAGVLYAGLGCMFLWFTRRRYPAALHNEDLEQ